MRRNESDLSSKTNDKKVELNALRKDFGLRRTFNRYILVAIFARLDKSILRISLIYELCIICIIDHLCL